MNKQERHVALADFYKKNYLPPESSKYCELYGVSNSAQVLENGLQVGNVNLNTVKDNTSYFIFSCVLRFPPNDSVYFAIHVGKDAKYLCEILNEMKARQNESIGDLNYTFNDNNKNVKIALNMDGRLYFKNKGQWDELGDLTSIGGKTASGVAVDSVTLAVHPVSPLARRSLAVSEFIGFIGKIVGKDKVHDVMPWLEETGVSSQMQRRPDSLSVKEIRHSIEALGGVYEDDLVERFHSSLNYKQSRHFVILGGISGTGKTNLILQYARAVHGIESMSEKDPFLFMCPVRPEWTDPTGLTGYHDILTDRYVVPTFLNAILVAISNPESPIFVCLDEMNLARVEYYFSDILSCIETDNGLLSLHSSSVPLEASIGGNVCADIPLPNNLYIIGTINIDESTNSLSDKVLDRAVYIDMSKVDLPQFHKKLMLQHSEMKDSILNSGRLLEDVNSVLEPHSLGFGYRLAKESILYHHFSVSTVGRDSELVLDELLVQKVLVKLKGSEYQREMLVRLSKLLDTFPRATQLLQALLKDLDQFGSFQNTR